MVTDTEKLEMIYRINGQYLTGNMTAEDAMKQLDHILKLPGEPKRRK
jgi:hypothetical protein